MLVAVSVVMLVAVEERWWREREREREAVLLFNFNFICLKNRELGVNQYIAEL